jgi:nucleoside-diphosphate-sugar epimerase
MKETYFVTGGAGYVGKLLLEKLISDENVEKVVVVDKDFLREDLKNNPKIIFIQKNLVDPWEEEVKKYNPTKVVHLAWQIRTMYGKQKLQNHWNIDGTQKVFDFAKNAPQVSTFVHFSTVASYGAMKENTFQTIFTESTPFRKTNYLYAEEKRIVEEKLKQTFLDTPVPDAGFIPRPERESINVFVIRPASITGPRGRERSSFGLQSALSGKIKNENILFKIISSVLKFMPATRGWARQFVYEQDIVNAILVMCNSTKSFDKIEKYNLCPTPAYRTPGEKNYIDANEMGKMLTKKVIYLPPQLVRILCFLAWHLTLGKIPTSPGVWKAYSYPIIVDGSKIERDFPEFKYQKDIRQAYLNQV